MMPTEHVLYSFRRCPYAIRARLALAISGISATLREVDLARKPAAMLAASGKGTVPVLVLANGTVIDESLSIMRWALVENDPETWLEREDADLIARNDGEFKYDLDRYKYPDRHQSDALAHRDRGLGFLRRLDTRLSAFGQLCGAKRGLTDMAILPFVRQFAAVDRQAFASLTLPHVQAWLASHLASSLFVTIMTRAEPWSPGDPAIALPAIFASSDEGVPA